MQFLLVATPSFRLDGRLPLITFEIEFQRASWLIDSAAAISRA